MQTIKPPDNMKQIITIFAALSILFIFSAPRVTAQDNKKSFLGIHLGAAFPTGDYSGTNPNSEKSGYALTGFSGMLKYTKMLGYEFGICLATHSEINPMNASELQLQINQQLQPLLPGFRALVSADSWNTSSFLFGAEYLQGLSSSSQSAFDMYVMIGYMNTTVPAVYVNFSYDSGTGYIYYPSQSAGAFAFSFGAGFYLSVSEKISIPVTVDYMGGTANFDSYVVNTSAGPDFVDGFDQPVSNVNLTTGIVIQFN